MYKENFDLLAQEFTPIILSLIRDKFVENYTRDDLFQECLIVLNNCNKTFDPIHKTRFSTYFYLAAKHRLYDLIREVNREKRPKYVYGDEIFNILQGEDLPSEQETNILEEIIEELSKLPRGDITKRIYLEGHTLEKIAEEEGISKQRVHFLNKRNLKKLKEIFKI